MLLKCTVLTVFPFRKDCIVAFLRLRVQRLYLLGTVLKVAVHDYGILSRCMIEACRDGSLLAEIPGKLYPHYFRVFIAYLLNL